MRKINLFLILIGLALSLTLMACSSSSNEDIFIISSNDKQENLDIKDEKNKQVLDMQGFYLEVPENYTCSGGFVNGYRYQEARCNPVNRDDFEILVDHGLVVSGINPEKGLVSNQLVVRSFEFSGGVYDLILCQEHFTRYLNIDGEHYLCFHTKDGNEIITMGTGKSYSNYGRWFETDLIIKQDTDYTQNDYIELLEKFLNQSIKINWEDYRNE